MNGINQLSSRKKRNKSPLRIFIPPCENASISRYTPKHSNEQTLFYNFSFWGYAANYSSERAMSAKNSTPNFYLLYRKKSCVFCVRAKIARRGGFCGRKSYTTFLCKDHLPVIMPAVMRTKRRCTFEHGSTETPEYRFRYRPFGSVVQPVDIMPIDLGGIDGTMT